MNESTELTWLIEEACLQCKQIARISPEDILTPCPSPWCDSQILHPILRVESVFPAEQIKTKEDV